MTPPIKLPETFPILPQDESLAAYKIWLIELSRSQGVDLLETDLTEAEWQKQHEDYWQSQ